MAGMDASANEGLEQIQHPLQDNTHLLKETEMYLYSEELLGPLNIGIAGTYWTQVPAQLRQVLEQIRLSIQENTRLLKQARIQLNHSEVEWRSNVEDFRRETTKAARDLEYARILLTKSEEWWQTHSAELLNKAQVESQQEYFNKTTAINAAATEEQRQLSDTAAAAIPTHAPGALSSDLSELSLLPLSDPGPGEWICVGSFDIASRKVPIALPLSAGVWTVTQTDQEQFRTLVRNTILRLVVSFDVPLIRTLVYDPGLILDIGSFAVLRTIEPLSVPPPLTSVEDLESLLSELVREITDVHDRLTAAGLDSYWEALATEHPLVSAIPVRLLVLTVPLKQKSHESGEMSEKGAARLKQIRNLAADHGLLIIESSDHASVPKNGLTIQFSNSGATASVVPSVRWTQDALVSDSVLRSVCDALVDRPRPSLAPSIPFRTIIESITDPWTGDGSDGLEVPIGLRKSAGLLTLSLRSADPAKPHVMVGGTNGSGKTNALFVLIHSLAARYSPQDLQFVLVDLKSNTSVDFEPFKPHATKGWLPHLRALGPQFDPDYSLAMLNWVKSQMEERSEKLSTSQTTSLAQYFTKTGKRIPRLVVVIDEFHRLFEQDTSEATEEAAVALEHIARTGRSVGVHLILSSQNFSRVSGLTRHSDSIFGQFHNRIALMSEASDMKAILSPTNTLDAKLKYAGEVVLNEDLGRDEAGNIDGTVADARDSSYLSDLRQQWYTKQHGRSPSVFDSSEYATWLPEFDVAKGGVGISPAVGLPIGIEAVPIRVNLTESPNQGLAVVGPDRSIAIPVLVRAVLTAAMALGDNTCVTLLDGDSPEDEIKPWIDALVQKLQMADVKVEQVGRASIPQRINDLAAANSSTRIIVPIALDSIDLSTRIGIAVPYDSLATLLTNGPYSKCWTIGWWQSLSTLRGPRQYSNFPGIRAWAFCGVSQQDLKDVCGTGVIQPTGRPRFVWFDKNDSTGAQRLVPFDAGDILEGASID